MKKGLKVYKLAEKANIRKTVQNHILNFTRKIPRMLTKSSVRNYFTIFFAI